MNLLILIMVAVVGIALGVYFGQVKSDVIVKKESKKKIKRKERILGVLRGATDGKITNNDVERLLGVSDSTATRYLDELEDEGKVIQVGETGRSVHYKLK